MSDDYVEYYDGNSEQPLAIRKSSIIPPVGSFISILGVTWKVRFVSYALDTVPSRTRANVSLEKVKE